MTAVASALSVAYDSVSGAFVVTSGITGSASSIAFATGALAPLLLLTQASGAILSQGANGVTPGAAMTALALVTQNWGTFMTVTDPDNGSGNALKLAFALWASQQNNRYAYICWDTDITPTENVPATGSLGYLIAQSGYSGTCLIWGFDNTKAAFICGAAAAINFGATNGRITFFGKGQAGLSPDVGNATVALNLIANGYNLYGIYATAAQQFQLFNNGSVSGKFLWLDSFINQIWLNSGLQTALMVLMTTVNSLPYNAPGYGLVENACLDQINAALNFGAIAAGVPLTALQAAEVNQQAGVNAAAVIQQRGWFLLVQPAPGTTRIARKTPPITLWYADGESIQQITLNSVDVQ
jgi:hypothetical protein